MALDPETLLGIKAGVLKAGAIGTVVGIVWRRQYRLAEGLSAAAAGFGCSIYIGPAGIGWFAIANEDVQHGIVFGCGLLGMYMVDAASTYFPRLLRGLAAKRLPPDPDDKTGGGA